LNLGMLHLLSMQLPGSKPCSIDSRLYTLFKEHSASADHTVA